MTAKYRVLVGDALSAEGLAVFDQYPDIEVVTKTGLSGDELTAEIQQSDAVLVRSKPNISAENLANPGRCKVIGRAGIGVDNVDVKAATSSGVIVMNTPGGNSVTTAEHTLAMIFAVARTLPQAHAKLTTGNWDKKAHSGVELYEKTLGVIGLGNIGRIVADRARGLKMRILGFDPFVTREQAADLGIELASIEEVIAGADFLTVHVPLTEKTRGLLGKEAFKSMKNTARIVNCARGGVVDEDALVEALDAGEIAGAALDVFAQEPLQADSPLLGHPKIILTPHLGASTAEAQINVAVQVAEQVAEFLNSGDIRNAINAPALSGETVEALGAHMKLGKILGTAHRQLRGGAASKVVIRCSGGFTRHDVEPIVRQVLIGLLSETVEQPVNTINAREIAQSRGIEVELSTTQEETAYTESILVEIVADGSTHQIQGAIFGDDEVRLVRFDEFQLEGIEPQGNILVVRNSDTPGVVGAVGTYLGNAGVNIARLQVSRNRSDNHAMMFLQIDGDVADDLSSGLAEQPMVDSALLLQL